MTRVSHALDRIDATFDDPNLVADAGLLLVATLSQRLGLEQLVNATVRLTGRVGGAPQSTDWTLGASVWAMLGGFCAAGPVLVAVGAPKCPDGMCAPWQAIWTGS